VKEEGKIKLVDRSGRSLDTVFAQPSLRAIKIWGGLPVPEDQK
jgi:hypothetical protein